MTFSSRATAPPPFIRLRLLCFAFFAKKKKQTGTMVLDLAAMDFNLKVKWWLRPRQLDGSTVEDYYTQFCNWRHEMVRLSIPAEEEDYVEHFILNLRWEIRYRLYRYESWSRLIDVYHDAKFEESMMIIEENLRQIKAHKVFDEMSHPENGENGELHGAEVVGDENGDEILVQIEADSENDVSPNAEDNKSTGLDFLVTNPIPDDSVDTDCDEMSEPNVQKVEAFISVTPIAGIPTKFDEAIFITEVNMKQIKASSVFDAMPIRTSVSIGSDSDDYNIDNSKVDIESNEQHGIVEVTMQLEDDSHNFALSNGVECKMFKCFTNKSIEPNCTCLNLFSGNFYPNSLIEVDLSLHKGEMLLNEKVEQTYSDEVTDVVFQLFDEMPHSLSFKLNSRFHGFTAFRLSVVELLREFRYDVASIATSDSNPSTLNVVTCCAIEISMFVFDSGIGATGIIEQMLDSSNPRQLLQSWNKVREPLYCIMVGRQSMPTSFILIQGLKGSLILTDPIGVILGMFTILTIEVSKAIDPKKDWDDFIVLMGHWKGTNEDIGSKFLELLSRMIPAKAVCNLTEYEDDSPVTIGRAENFIMHILGVSFSFKILEPFLFISCHRYEEEEYHKKALETTFGEFTVSKYLVFVYDPGRWYNPTLQRVDRADPIHLMIQQSFGYETGVVCISKWTQSVLVTSTKQGGIMELKNKQLHDQLLHCTYDGGVLFLA